MAHPTVAVAEAGVAGAAGGELFRGCRSSGNLGVGVREHGRMSWGVLRTPEITVSTSVGSDTSWGGCGHGHAMAGGERFSGKVVGLAREGGGARGEGESGRGLTAVLLVLLARQGRHGVRRIDGGELRWPATEWRWWRRCRASGGPWVGGEEGGGRGGASGLVGGAREARWPWLWRAAATGAFGCARRRGEGETKGTSEGVQGFGAAPKRRPEASRWPR